MNRRSLFRTLGAAAIIAGVNALPKLPKDVIPEGGPAFTKEKSEPLSESGPFTFEMPWFDSGIPAGGAIWQVPSVIPYPLMGNNVWTSSGANSIVLTNVSNPTTTGSAAPAHFDGFYQATKFVPATGDEAFGNLSGYVGTFGGLSVFDTNNPESPLMTVVYPPDQLPVQFSEVIKAERFFVHSLGGLSVELSNGTVLRRPDGSHQWEPVT